MRAHAGAIACVALALAGCSANTPPPKAATAPTPKVVPDSAQIDALLRATFGPTATLTGTWLEGTEGEKVQHRVCARRAPLAAGGDTGLLVICNESPEGMTNATEDLLALQRGAQGWQLVARKPDIQANANGAAVDPEFVQISPSLWAVATQDNFMGQGWMIAGAELWAVRGSEFVQVATYNTLYDNSGNCGDDDCDGKGISLESQLDFDTKSKGPAWPLTVQRKGTLCDKPYEHNFRYEFDAAAFSYHTPEEGPPEVECGAAGG